MQYALCNYYNKPIVTGKHDGNKTFLTGKPVGAGPSDAHKIYQDTTGKNKNLLVYAQDNSISGID